MKCLIALLVILSASSVWAMPAQVLIIRHAEKPDEGNELNERGFKRAELLVNFFETNPAVTEYGTPVAIYSASPKKASSSIRSIQTVTPLAKALNLEIHTDFTKDDIKELVEEISSEKKYDGKMVLICWEHKVIPDIALEFGATNAPDSWDGDVFDHVWKIDFSNDSNFKSFEEFSEKVLPGDE